jgi:protein tyrosine phosphatase
VPLYGRIFFQKVFAVHVGGRAFSRIVLIEALYYLDKHDSKTNLFIFQSEPTRVLVHCVAGAGRSGTFAGCVCVIQQLLAIQSADVFR